MYTVLITLTTLHSEIIITRSRREYAENVEKKRRKKGIKIEEFFIVLHTRI